MDQSPKKNLFFFGQPGCLKFNIPIRTSTETEEKSSSEENSTNSQNNENDSTKKAEITSDSDSEDLLKKIDAALDENGENECEGKDLPDKSENNAGEINETQKPPVNNEEEIAPSKSNFSEDNNLAKKSESALEQTSSASNELNVEKVETISVKCIDNSKSNENTNLVLDECKQVDLINEKTNEKNSPKSIEISDNEKVEETENTKNLKVESEKDEKKALKCSVNNLEEVVQVNQIKDSIDTFNDEIDKISETDQKSEENNKIESIQEQIWAKKESLSEGNLVDTSTLNLESSEIISSPKTELGEDSTKVETSLKQTENVEVKESFVTSQNNESFIINVESESTIKEKLPENQEEQITERKILESTVDIPEEIKKIHHEDDENIHRKDDKNKHEKSTAENIMKSESYKNPILEHESEIVVQDSKESSINEKPDALIKENTFEQETQTVEKSQKELVSTDSRSNEEEIGDKSDDENKLKLSLTEQSVAEKINESNEQALPSNLDIQSHSSIANETENEDRKEFDNELIQEVKDNETIQTFASNSEEKSPSEALSVTELEKEPKEELDKQKIKDPEIKEPMQFSASNLEELSHTSEALNTVETANDSINNYEKDSTQDPEIKESVEELSQIDSEKCSLEPKTEVKNDQSTALIEPLCNKTEQIVSHPEVNISVDEKDTYSSDSEKICTEEVDEIKEIKILEQETKSNDNEKKQQESSVKIDVGKKSLEGELLREQKTDSDEKIEVIEKLPHLIESQSNLKSGDALEAEIPEETASVSEINKDLRVKSSEKELESPEDNKFEITSHTNVEIACSQQSDIKKEQQEDEQTDSRSKVDVLQIQPCASAKDLDDSYGGKQNDDELSVKKVESIKDETEISVKSQEEEIQLNLNEKSEKDSIKISVHSEVEALKESPINDNKIENESLTVDEDSITETNESINKISETESQEQEIHEDLRTENVVESEIEDIAVSENEDVKIQSNEKQPAQLLTISSKNNFTAERKENLKESEVLAESKIQEQSAEYEEVKGLSPPSSDKISTGQSAEDNKMIVHSPAMSTKCIESPKQEEFVVLTEPKNDDPLKDSQLINEPDNEDEIINDNKSKSSEDAAEDLRVDHKNKEKSSISNDFTSNRTESETVNESKNQEISVTESIIEIKKNDTNEFVDKLENMQESCIDNILDESKDVQSFKSEEKQQILEPTENESFSKESVSEGNNDTFEAKSAKKEENIEIVEYSQTERTEKVAADQPSEQVGNVSSEDENLEESSQESIAIIDTNNSNEGKDKEINQLEEIQEKCEETKTQDEDNQFVENVHRQFDEQEKKNELSEKNEETNVTEQPKLIVSDGFNNIDEPTEHPLCLIKESIKPSKFESEQEIEDPHSSVTLASKEDKLKETFTEQRKEIVEIKSVENKNISKSNLEITTENISQKSITVRENLNEKINDNQVDLSKIDNKSLSLEKVCTSENIIIQNEFTEDLDKTTLTADIPKSTSHVDNIESEDGSEFQPQINESIVDKIDSEKTREIEEKVCMEKQYESISKHQVENVLADSGSEKCVQEMHVNVALKYENVTDTMVLKETSKKEMHTDNEKDSVDESVNAVNVIESESKKNEYIEFKNKIEKREHLNEPVNEIHEISSSNEVICSQSEESLVQTIGNENKNEGEEEVKQTTVAKDEPPVDPLAGAHSEIKNFDDLINENQKLDTIPITKSKSVVTRKRKISERKSISESDSDGGNNFATDSVSHEKSSDEETVATKKPRIRNKITATRNTRATRQSARVSEEVKVVETKEDEKTEQKEDEKTLQSLKFDFDENEDVAANMAAIKTLICKDTSKKDNEERESDESSGDESLQKKPARRGRKAKRGRTAKRTDPQESSSDESKSAKVPDSKRSKTSESEETTVEKQTRKKRESAGKGMLKHIDTSLVIETVETETPVRQSRRIAQQKIREETERRQMEEKMLKQMKEEAERRKKLALISEPPDEEDEKDDSSDESYKGSRKKKKKKLKPTDKPWQTSSSHSEQSESEEEFERPPSEDPGSPLFRSDHEFSPESDVDDAPGQPVKRARTAKKQVEESSSDDEDVNPNHACQVCHKTDSPEWILLCDECDHGYHCSCLKPIIFCIPSGNWYCPLCCHKKLVDSLTMQLGKLDDLISNIKAEEIRQQKQLEIKKLTEITEENILKERRKKRAEMASKREQSRDHSKTQEGSDEKESDDEDDDENSSDNSSDNAPLNEIFYKLRRRNQTTTSYRFNDYDDLINSAIRDEMEEVKGMGNAGRGKDISTIIEADKEEKKLQKMEKEKEKAAEEKTDDQKEEPEPGEESSDSDVIRSKKAMQRKKKNRKLNNLDETSEEDQASDEDFKGSGSTNSDTEEEYSVSGSVSESSLDLPLKKSKIGKRSTRSAAKNRRYDETFINDNSSDDEPLIKKRTKKQVDSDEDDFDGNDEENSDGSSAEDIDSEELCDDTDTEDSSENNWPKKKKKRAASYDIKKPRKHAKKSDEGNDKAFRAGISKKKILKQSENESEASDNDSVKGRRKTRGKKLLYLIEDDYESDDGIKPGIGVVRPETPPEEREMFFKKQEEIKRMLAEKNTEAARQLAVPTIEPIKIAIDKPESPTPPELTSGELESLSTIPKNVIEGAKALDLDYNKIKPPNFGIHLKGTSAMEHPSAQDMSEEDLARMMEEEDFAQHQLKLVGESLGRNKLLELEVKEEAFSGFGKGEKIKEEKPIEKIQQPEGKKRARKVKPEKQSELSSPPAKAAHSEVPPHIINSPQHIIQSNVPVNVPTTSAPMKSLNPSNIPSIPPLISNPISHPPYPNLAPPRYGGPGPHPFNMQDRPSVLSNYMPRHESVPRLEGVPPRLEIMPSRLERMPLRLEGIAARLEGMRPRLEGVGPRLEVLGPRMEGMPPHLRFPQPPADSFIHKPPSAIPHLQPQQPAGEEVEEKKKGRRKKYTPLRTDLHESNVPKVAKLDTPTTSSVIHSTLNLSSERPPDDKGKVSLPPLQRAKTAANAPEIFNPAANPTSVITRLLQPQQRPPFGGFVEQMNVAVSSANSPSQSPGSRAFPEDMKHHPIAKQIRPGPQPQFPDNPFVPRTMHTLYRGPPTSQPSIYGIPSHHARIPYAFHHLHPNNNLRPNMQEYGAPYNIPPQFGYYAPPAHTRQHPQNPAAPPVSQPEPTEIPPNSTRTNNVNPNDEPSESSEFGGLVSYFSSQQELD